MTRPPREGRILIVDDQRDIARVLKTSLELLNRGYFVLDVPSGEEAMLEVQRKEFDIVVTDYRLPGMTGPELIIKLRKKNPGLKAVLITANPVSEVKREIREKGIEVLVGIFEKPLDTAAFTAAIDAAVLGEHAATAQPVVMAEDPLGPIPEFNQLKISNILSNLMRDLGANGVVFADRKGRVLLTEGQLDQALRFTELAVLLAYNFTTTAEISGYLGDEPSSAVHYYDGNWHDIYALSVGMHFFLTIIFPAGSQKQMGPVLRFGKPAAQEMIGVIGLEALGQPEAELSAAEEAIIAERLGEQEEQRPARRAEKRKAEAPAAEAEPAPLPKPKTAPLPALEIDLEALDAELGSAGTEGNLDGYWEEAAAATDVRPDDAITREEAIALGLIPKEEE